MASAPVEPNVLSCKLVQRANTKTYVMVCQSLARQTLCFIIRNCQTKTYLSSTFVCQNHVRVSQSLPNSTFQLLNSISHTLIKQPKTVNRNRDKSTNKTKEKTINKNSLCWKIPYHNRSSNWLVFVGPAVETAADDSCQKQLHFCQNVLSRLLTFNHISFIHIWQILHLFLENFVKNT